MVDRGARPGITAVVLAPAGADLRGLVEHLAEVGLDEVVVVDRSEGGGLVVESASVIHERSVSRGVALHRAAQTARGGLLVLLEPGDRLVEGRLSRAVASMAADPGVTAHVAVARLPDGSTRSAGARGLVLTREALCQVSRAAFFPVELELLSRLRGEGRLVEDDEVGVVPGSWDPGRIASDEQLLALGSHDGPPEISVIMATYDRRAVLLECLEALSRQSVPRGTHEVIVVEDGSPDDTAAWVADLELPIPFRYVRQDNAGASAARRIRERANRRSAPRSAVSTPAGIVSRTKRKRKARRP